jgi:hypothetical protein
MDPTVRRIPQFLVARRWAVLGLAAAAALVFAAAPRSYGADVQFDPPAGFVCDTLDVDVTIDGSVTDLRGSTFVFEFDPAVVVPIAVGPGALVTGAGCGNFFTWLNAAAIGDSIAVDGATLGCSVAGPGSIVRVRFARVAYAQTSPLECRRGAMRNSLNQPIPFTCHPGTLETCPAVAVTSRRWGFVKRLYH